MLKIVTIVGARPQIIKAAAISRAIRAKFAGRMQEVLVHTGQHYDENMSGVFFEELGLPLPNYNLDVRSGTHGRQTADMISGIEKVLQEEKPDCVIVYGDTNTTLAGSLTACKLHIPVVHIEAGLRSFNKEMPEEINRILSDHVSTLLFTPTRAGLENLVKEGLAVATPGHESVPASVDHPKVYHCGDIMYDNSLYFSKVASEKIKISDQLGLRSPEYALATIHRDYNTDDAQRLTAIFRALSRLAKEDNLQIIIPLHPRTSNLLEKNIDPNVLASVRANTNIYILPPVSFLEMVALEASAKLILTDSGGVQKEAFFFRKPCVILRSETEWIELVNNGNARLADADEEKILKAYRYFSRKEDFSYPAFYGDGHTAEFICREIFAAFANS